MPLQAIALRKCERNIPFAIASKKKKKKKGKIPRKKTRRNLPALF